MKKILVKGAKGQLGRCIKDASTIFSDTEFIFVSKKELDKEDYNLIKDFVKHSVYITTTAKSLELVS